MNERLGQGVGWAIAAAAFIAAVGFASAEPPSVPGSSPVKKASLRLTICHAFGDSPLRPDDVSCRTGGGAAGGTQSTVSISRLSYLISGVRLIAADGTRTDFPQTVGFVNAVSGRTSIDLPAITCGEYRGIEFDIGVPKEVNHADPASFGPSDQLNPTINNLHWNWQGGFVFLAIEGRWVRGDDSLGGYSYHIATDAHLMHISVPAAMNVREDSTVVLSMDAAKVFDSQTRIVISDDPITQSTHSGKDDVLAEKLAANIERAFSFVSIAAREGDAAPIVVRPTSIPSGTTAYNLTIPEHFPRPVLPPDNPLTVEGVRLGKRLFNDVRLSSENAQSCASCHRTSAAYSDGGKALSVGVDGRTGTRNAMPLFNLAWAAESGYTWDGRKARIRDQALAPIQDAREMHQTLERAIVKLGADRAYAADFADAFGSPGITPERLGLAIEQYLLTLISADSRFDRVLDKKETLNPQEKRGLLLFVTEHDPARGQFGADCFHCHGIPLFTDHQFRSNGLDVESADPGRQGVTANAADRGRFRTPSLRNIARTAPYMHDGRFKTLEEVLDHYSEHLRAAPSLDPNLAKHILTMPDGEKRAGVHLPPEDRDALIAFLRTLTDESFLKGEGEASSKK